MHTDHTFPRSAKLSPAAVEALEKIRSALLERGISSLPKELRDRFERSDGPLSASNILLVSLEVMLKTILDSNSRKAAK